LDFAKTKQLDPRITFSRASTGTYEDASGVIQSAASGVARFDHDPATGESLGLLVEEARTNLQLYSNSPDNTWWNQPTKAIDIVPNSITAPDNTVTAAFFPTGGQFGRNRITTTFSFYSLSCFVKASTATSIELSIDSDGASAVCFATYTFSANSIVATMGGANSPSRYRNLSATSVNYPNGWIRLCFIFEFYANAGVGINTKYNLIGGSGYVWGAQLEAGSFPTTYIPTTTATVTRAADLVQITGTNFSSWHNQIEGTLVVETFNGLGGLGGGANLSYLGISAGALQPSLSVGNGIKYASGSPSNYTRAMGVISGTSVFDSNSLSNPSKIAIAYKQDNFAVARAAILALDTSGNVPPGMDTLTLRGVGVTSYKRLTYWPTRLSDAMLQTLTR
jgi:hypothetical protein